VVGIFGLITGLCFFFYGNAKVPMQRLASVFVDPVELVSFPLTGEAIASATGFTCGGSVCVEGIKSFQEVNVSLAVYMIALMALFGWIFLVLFGGIGLITLPLDLIFAWKDRPVKIELEQYCKLRLAMKERSGRLLEFGKTLEAETSGRAMTIAQRNLFNKFKGEALKTEADWNKVKTAYSGEGISSIIYPIQLGVGCLGAVISLMWILHLILYSCIKNARGGRILTGFLNTAFVGGERIFPMITLSLYTIFTFWLLWCVLRGYTKIGLRAVAVPLFPLKKAGTYINSILVNTALVVCTSIAVITFCSFQLDGYLL
jgi:LMBR1 domain-containing protein 1